MEEEPPDSMFYNPAFQRAIEQSRSLAKQLANALSSCELHSQDRSSVSRLYRQAKDASRYESPVTWRIGFIGDSGAGQLREDMLVLQAWTDVCRQK